MITKISLFVFIFLLNLPVFGQIETEQIDQGYIYAALPTEEGRVYYLSRVEKTIFKNERITASLNYYDGYNTYSLVNIPGTFVSSSQFSILPFEKNKLLIFHPERSSDGMNDLYIYDIVTNSLSELGNKSIEISAIHLTEEGLFSISNSDAMKTRFYEYADGEQRLLFEKIGPYTNIAQFNGLIYTFKNKNGLEVFDLKGNKIKEVTKDNIETENFLYESPNISFSQKEIIDGKLVLNFKDIIPSIQVLNSETGNFEAYKDFVGENYGVWFSDKKGNSVLQKSVGENKCGNDLIFYNKSEKGECVDHKLPNYPMALASLDFEKNIWIGFEGGLYKVSFNKSYVTTLLKGASLRAVYPLNDNELLIGSESDGLFLINRHTGEAKAFLEREEDFFIGNRGFFKDKKNNFWINSINGFSIYSNGFKTRENIATERLQYAFQMGNGNIIGGSYDHSLVSIYPISHSQKTTSTYPEFGDFHGHIPLRDENKSLILGTGGVLLYNDLEGSISIVDTSLGQIISGYKESESIFWLGFENGKLSRNKWDGKELKEIESFTFPSTIATITPAEDGRLWLGTFDGIAVFNPVTKDFNFLDNSIISHPESNRFSAFYDNALDKMYIGTVDGLNIIETSKFENQVSEFRVFNANITHAQKDKNIAKEIKGYLEDEVYLEIPAEQRYLRLRFSANTAINNKNLTYFYRIDNGSWIDNGKQNELSLPFLESGQHLIEVYAKSSENVRSSNTLKVNISVDSFYYQKWWFRLILLLMGISIAYFWYRRIKNENKRLETTVAERTDELKKDKEIIEQQAERLLELDKTKSKFFANVSHELRTPITLIKGPIQSVLKNKNLDKQTFNLLSTAERNTANLLGLVNEILDLTKLEARKLTLDEKATNLYAFLSRIVFNFQSIADVQNIAFSFDYQLDKSLHIQLDEAKLEKVLNNLLSNAFKFTPENGRIEVKVTENSSGIKIAVKDRGRGISPEDIPHVFNRFYQSKNNTKAEGGLGIGLSLSMEFVKLMHGKLWVESSTKGMDKGSTFYVEIPKKEVAVPAIDSQPVVLSNTVITEENILSTQHKHTILLVEDNEDLRAYVSFLLRPFYTIIPARNGQEALEKLAKNNCQLILSDVMMPIMDGFEFLDTVKSMAIYRNIPFIMLTARAELKDRLKALRIGVDDYMLKPFDETELLVRIKNLLTNYENRLNYFSKSQASEQAELLSILEQDKLWLQNLEMLVLRDINNSIFSVDYLVQILDTNRNTFYSKVKTLTGLSPNKYVQLIRLQKAKDLLENSTLSVKEITQKVGFKTPDYFTRLFKNEYGKLPSDYLR